MSGSRLERTSAWPLGGIAYPPGGERVCHSLEEYVAARNADGKW